jgi:hypothetical protein
LKTTAFPHLQALWVLVTLALAAAGGWVKMVRVWLLRLASLYGFMMTG